MKALLRLYEGSMKPLPAGVVDEEVQSAFRLLFESDILVPKVRYFSTSKVYSRL